MEKKLNRSAEITQSYFTFLDKHIEDVVSGKLPDFMELNEIASELHISHSHLSDTIQQETGNHPCHFYDLKIIEQAKKMLLRTNLSVAEIAQTLTYNPSNFTKFFKKFVAETPKQWREKIARFAKNIRKVHHCVIKIYFYICFQFFK